MQTFDTIQLHVQLFAPLACVWEYLCIPDLMQRWMGDEQLQVKISSEQKEGGALIISTTQHGGITNKGTIITMDPYRELHYSQLSDISNLPDEAQNYTHLHYHLISEATYCKLQLVISGFPDEIIYKHHQLYWPPSLQILKQCVEIETAPEK